MCKPWYAWDSNLVNHTMDMYSKRSWIYCKELVTLSGKPCANLKPWLAGAAVCKPQATIEAISSGGFFLWNTGHATSVGWIWISLKSILIGIAIILWTTNSKIKADVPGANKLKDTDCPLNYLFFCVYNFFSYVTYSPKKNVGGSWFIRILKSRSESPF